MEAFNSKKRTMSWLINLSYDKKSQKHIKILFNDSKQIIWRGTKAMYMLDFRLVIHKKHIGPKKYLLSQNAYFKFCIL